MYKYITNPITGKKCNIKSREGQIVISNYRNMCGRFIKKFSSTSTYTN